MIHLPVTVKEFIKEKKEFRFTEEEFDYIRCLVLHMVKFLSVYSTFLIFHLYELCSCDGCMEKDESIIAVNKPSGLPVQVITFSSGFIKWFMLILME